MIAGTLVPLTKGLRAFTVLGMAQRLGRSPDNGAWLLHVARVSWNHAEIVATERGWVLRDIGGKHGTCANRRRVDTRVLASGDVVNLSHHARFTWNAHTNPYTPNHE